MLRSSAALLRLVCGTVRRNTAVLVAVLLWIPAVGWGIQKLLVYSSTPGARAIPPAEWPRGSMLAPAQGRPTLVVFVHPQCPCSRATLGELARIVTRCRDRVDVHAVFYAPASEPEAWVRGDLWREAEMIPRVHAVEDSNGAEIRRFGATTSGQVLLYDPHGRLLFSGGITASRGHAGDNYGRDAIVALIENKSRPQRISPVFGCSLMGKQ